MHCCAEKPAILLESYLSRHLTAAHGQITDPQQDKFDQLLMGLTSANCSLGSRRLMLPR
jgi:hypothetical protein